MTNPVHRRIAYLIIEPMLNEFGLTCKSGKLFYIHYFKANERYTILVSRDTQDIFKFLKMDYGRFKKGFKNLYELFDFFILSCPYFNKYICTSQNVAKLSDDDKSTIRAFKSYLEKTPLKKEFNYPSYLNLNLEIVNNFFSERSIKVKILQKTKKLFKASDLAKKFNVSLVHSWAPDLKAKRDAGLTGRTLKGFVDFIEGVKTSFQSYLQETSAETIKEDFVVYYEHLKH